MAWVVELSLWVSGLTPPWNLKSLRSIAQAACLILITGSAISRFPPFHRWVAWRCSRPGRGEAQLAAGAFRSDDGMHLLGGADDGVDRAGLDAEGAADTGLLVDEGDRLRLFDTVFFVERLVLAAKQVGQLAHAFVAAGRALVDVRLALGDRVGVGPAAGKTALSALCLRQDRVDLLDQRIAFDLEMDRGESQRRAEHQGNAGHHEKGREHG